MSIPENINKSKFRDPDPTIAANPQLSDDIITYGLPNTPYIKDPDGYPPGPQKKSVLRPRNLEFQENIISNATSTPRFNGSSLSNSLQSMYYAVNDFTTFGCYIHHNMPAELPPNLHELNENNTLYGFMNKRPFIINGSINVFPKLQKVQQFFNFYTTGPNRFRP